MLFNTAGEPTRLDRATKNRLLNSGLMASTNDLPQQGGKESHIQSFASLD